jgi:parallel beta-helix repeat protein
MADVFISYASEDRGAAQAIARALENEGWTVWWDRHLLPGGRFSRVIEQQLAESRAVVVLWTDHSVESDWVKAEAHEAIEHNKLVPIQVGTTRPPLLFRQIQTVQLKSPSLDVGSATSSIIQALKKVIGAPPHRGPETHASPFRAAVDEPTDVPENAIVVGLKLQTLSDALRVCDEQGTIVVEPGEYRESLLITKPVTLAGRTKARDSRIVGDVRVAMVVQGTKALLKDLTVFGVQGGAAIAVSAGHLLVRNCQVEGGGTGFQVSDAGKLSVEGGTVIGSRSEGVSVCDGGSATLIDMTIRFHPRHGIAVFRSGSASIANCVVASNDDFGISVQYNSSAEVQSCEIEKNRGGGIEVRDGSRSSIKGCRVSQNHQGIRLAAGSDADLNDNTIFENLLSGVFVLGGAGAMLASNRISYNHENGVYILESGQARLIENQIHHNGLAGVCVNRGGEVNFERNQVHANRNCGIIVRHSSAFLNDNRLVDNGGSGLLFEDAQQVEVNGGEILGSLELGVKVFNGGQARLSRVRIAKSELSGVLIHKQADALIDACWIEDSAENGVYFWDVATGMIKDTTIIRSGYSGVASRLRSAAVIHSCQIRESRQIGVYVYEGAACQADLTTVTSSGREAVAVIHPASHAIFSRCVIDEQNAAGVFTAEGAVLEVRGCKFDCQRAPCVWVGKGGCAAVRSSVLRPNALERTRLDEGGVLDIDETEQPHM